MADTSSSHLKSRYDAIIVGAGHNGLTAAGYLARAGLDVLVFERREIVGGAAVTEEVAPRCRVSSCSYIASMLEHTAGSVAGASVGAKLPRTPAS